MKKLIRVSFLGVAFIGPTWGLEYCCYYLPWFCDEYQVSVAPTEVADEAVL